MTKKRWTVEDKAKIVEFLTTFPLKPENIEHLDVCDEYNAN